MEFVPLERSGGTPHGDRAEKQRGALVGGHVFGVEAARLEQRTRYDIEKGKLMEYRVHMNVTFVLED